MSIRSIPKHNNVKEITSHLPCVNDKSLASNSNFSKLTRSLSSVILFKFKVRQLDDFSYCNSLFLHSMNSVCIAWIWAGSINSTGNVVDRSVLVLEYSDIMSEIIFRFLSISDSTAASCFASPSRRFKSSISLAIS